VILVLFNAVAKSLRSDDDAGVRSQYIAYYVAAITVLVCGFVIVTLLSLLTFSRLVRSASLDSESSKPSDSKESKYSISMYNQVV
jgi:hypothetical protein